VAFAPPEKQPDQPSRNSAESLARATPANGVSTADTEGDTEHETATAGGNPQRPYRAFTINPLRWDLWRQPTRLIVFVTIVELCALAGLAHEIAVAGAPTPLAWTRFAILVVGATIHVQLTHRQEERRRSRIISVHIDLTAVWIFPAALVLPVPLTLLLVAIIRTQRWFTARRPPHKFFFSSVSIAFAATLAHTTLTAFGPIEWTLTSGLGALHTFGALMLAGMVYTISQAAFTGGFLALGGTSAPTLRNVLGSKADNLLEVVTVGLGAVTAILLVNVPPAVAIMALVTVIFNRLAELDQLHADVRTDSKTGVFNMRGWSESAERALSRTSRADEGLALLMIDLDHFKWINDTYGHPAGDDVLRNIAQTLDEATRPSDVVGRFGGEEFLVLLPDIDEGATELAAERVRRAIADLRIATTDKRGGEAIISGRTTSIGVAVYPRHGTTLESLLHAADTAVYEAKESGRNQVRFAPRDRPVDGNAAH
jgi:diguanylate cyclase (GGDEF)-like protein